MSVGNVQGDPWWGGAQQQSDPWQTGSQPGSTIAPHDSVSQAGTQGFHPQQPAYTEMYEQDWVLSMVDDVEEVNAVIEKHRILVDSGCATTVLKKGQYEAPVRRQKTSFHLSDISGGEIPQYGRQEPKGRLQSGRVGTLPGTTVDAKRSALAVSESVDAGNSVVFTPHGAFMTKVHVPIPPDAEMFERDGKLWYLPFEEIAGGCEQTQPICPVGTGRGRGMGF